ncbi:hypothetical protein NicSoilE8_17680 [Arthrobacter sp. NicSoilE8]|nr:hypothetical protein NicSoilE8_17680 [Arthrobacter sp. NicSoilE8]
MRAIDLEARVITAVDRIRAGQLAEHDLIECKRDWPQESKARQLAGSLNRAGGDPVIYIIGIDEKTAEVFDVSSTDVLDWWGQITPRFDHTPPEMIRHIAVPVGENGEHVVAVAFASDRAPYVVKTGNANPSLEVPMREGTGTRSARRDELLRILIPAVRLPQIVVLGASLQGEYFPPATNPHTEEFSCTGELRIYVEHSGEGIVTFPAHGMRGKVTVQDNKFDLHVVPPLETARVPTGPTQFHYQRQSDGVSVTGPRAVPYQVAVRGLTPEHLQLWAESDKLEIEVTFEVLHSIKPLNIELSLSRNRVSNLGELVSTEGDDVFMNNWTPGTWRFKHPGLAFDD